MKPEILKPETWNCSYAAPPEDINWENLTNSRVMWYLKSGFLHGLILILVIFLTTPKHAAEHFDDFLHLTLGKNDIIKNRHWKLGHRSAICWNYLGLFRDYGLDPIFFGIKLVFQDRKLKFSPYVWKSISWNLTKFQLIQLIQTIFNAIFFIGCPIEFKFFQTDAENFGYLSWKIIKFY